MQWAALAASNSLTCIVPVKRSTPKSDPARHSNNVCRPYFFSHVAPIRSEVTLMKQRLAMRSRKTLATHSRTGPMAAAAASAGTCDTLARPVAFMGYGKMADSVLAARGIPSKAQFVVMEKIHGANFMCSVTDEGVNYASRRRVLDPSGTPFYNYGLVDIWLSPRAKALHKVVSAMVASSGYVLHQVDIVGELYGAHWPGRTVSAQPVQTMPLIWYSPRLEFAAFDVRLWVSPASAPAPPPRGTYVDWPVAERLLTGFGIPMPPIFGLHPREDALAWRLPMESAVKTKLGLSLPEGTSVGLESEGVVIKCEVERKPLPLELLACLASATGLVGDESGISIAHATSGTPSDWSGIPTSPEAFARLPSSYAKPVDRERWVKLMATARDDTDDGAAEAAAGAPTEDAVVADERTERWMAKVKCPRFLETHRVPRKDAAGVETESQRRGAAARAIATAYVPSRSTKLPAGIVAAVCERLTAARMGGAVSKVGPPPMGACKLLEQWHGKPPMPLWSAELADAVAEGRHLAAASDKDPTVDPAALVDAPRAATAGAVTIPEGEAAVAEATVAWARAVAAEVMADLAEELWKDKAKEMGKLASGALGFRPQLCREDSDAYNNMLVDAVRDAGVEAGLPEPLADVACEPVIGALTHLARTYVM